MNKEEMLNAAKAFFIAPLAAPLLYFLGTLAIVGTESIRDLNDILMLAFYIFLLAAPVSYIATALLGIPVIYCLKRYHCFNIMYLSLAGFLLGGLVLTLLPIIMTGFKVFFAVKEHLLFFLAGGGMGLGVSLLFGYIAGLNRESIWP